MLRQHDAGPSQIQLSPAAHAQAPLHLLALTRISGCLPMSGSCMSGER
jgi:hypothetical protein